MDEQIAKCKNCGKKLSNPGAMGKVCPTCLLLLRAQSIGAGADNGSLEFEPLTEAELSELLPNYEIVALIDRGGMGAVYKAVQLNLDRTVAIKLLPMEVAVDPEFETRFSREARTMAKLEHPNIVRIYDFGDIEGQFYFVMEYVEGSDLMRHIREGDLEVDEVCDIACKLCDALQYAHERGIVHRDLKPANVLVTNDKEPKLADFGLAKMHGNGREDFDLTRTRASMGTPHYMAPEQLADTQSVDSRADIYSVGVIVYELLTKSLPIGNFSPPSSLAPVTSELDEAILRALKSDPEERFQSIGDLKRALESVRGELLRAKKEKHTAVLLFEDIVDSVGLNARLGTDAFVEAIGQHDRIIKSVVDEAEGARVIQHAGDGYLIRVDVSSTAVAIALRIQYRVQKHEWKAEPVRVRIGLHMGEVIEITEENTGVTKPVGLAINMASRVMDVALPNQILMTRVIFDDARQYLKDHPELKTKTTAMARQHALVWPAHGRYLFSGNDEAMEIFEVGAEGLAPLQPPPDSEKAKRAVAADEEQTLGWRPGAGLQVPHRPSWILKKKIGEGGFGEVWLAEHRRTEAVRVYKFCFDAMRLRSFKRELTLFRLLRSSLGNRSDIAAIHEVQVESPPFYLESDYLPNGNLGQWAESQGGIAFIPLETRIALVAGIARAVAAAHSVGIIHKDIKPSNVLIDVRDGQPYPVLTDFGIGNIHSAQKLDELGISHTGFTDSLFVQSSRGSDSGTRLYSAPEYLVGGQPTVKGDIYALGILLYQLIAGDLRKPLGTGWKRHIDIPLLVDDISACVDVDPEQRLESATVLADRLESLHQRQQEVSRLAAASRRNRVLRVGAVVTAIAACVFGFSFFQLRRSERMAQRARDQAEDLIGYIIEGQYYALEPVGRLDLLEDVMVNVSEYYNGLPPELVTNKTRLRESTTLQRIGVIYRDRGDLNRSLESLDEVIKIRQDLVASEPDNFEWQNELADVHDAAGVIRFRLGRTTEAEESLGEAMKIRKKLRDLFPENTDWQNGLANVYNNLAAVRRQRGDMDDAASYYKAALVVREDLYRANPDDRRWKFFLCWTHNNFGHFLLRHGQPQDAGKSFLGMRELVNDLLQIDDSNSKYLLGQAASAYGAGVVSLHDGDYSNAEDNLTEARNVLMKMVDGDPENANWRYRLANVYRGLGDLHLFRRNLTAARDAYQDGYAQIESLAQDDSDNLRFRWQMAALGGALARVGIELSDAETVAMLDASLDILATQIEQDATNPEWLSTFGSCQSTSARRSQLAGETELALRSAKGAVATFGALAQFEPNNPESRLEHALALCRLSEIAPEESPAVLAQAREILSSQKAIIPGSPRLEQLEKAISAAEADSQSKVSDFLF